MRRFIKDDLLCEKNKIEKLMLMDVEEKSNWNSYKKIDVGFCTESAPRDARTNAFFDLVTWPGICRVGIFCQQRN